MTKVGEPINCAYERVGRIWVCKIHSRPSKHKVDSHSRYPCLALDPWTVKELDTLHERAGTYAKWIESAKRKEVVDQEREMKERRALPNSMG